MELDRNQALKRIREEYREIESNPSDELMCGLLKRKKFQWQFAVRGAIGTEFEGGIYHGRVLFPREYPFKPPSIIALTENGRFKTHTEISLRRLDKWQSSYRVRDVFVDFVHLMPTATYPDELCSLECNKEERRDLAIKSRAAAPKYGTPERQKVIDQIHQYMLSKAPNGTGGGSVPSQASNGTGGVYIIGNTFRGVNIIGNIFCATNSDGVGFLGSMYAPFIGGGGTLGPVWSRTPTLFVFFFFLKNFFDGYFTLISRVSKWRKSLISQTCRPHFKMNQGCFFFVCQSLNYELGNLLISSCNPTYTKKKKMSINN